MDKNRSAFSPPQLRLVHTVPATARNPVFSLLQRIRAVVAAWLWILK